MIDNAIKQGIYALYEKVIEERALGGMSDPVTSAIRVKQECPLSPTLFGLYIDKILDYIDRWG